ncbi:MAG: SDR family NAD(P)-dependent oxidoreductase [Burkholderiaceae bacterium]
MNLNLAGKNVVITGGSKGIGLACAHAFAEEGANVALVARNANTLGEAAASLSASGVRVVTHAADLGDSAQVERMAAAVQAQWGEVHILVNCAGAARRTPPMLLQSADWRAAMDAKFFPYVNTIGAFLMPMLERKSGAIVNVIGAGGKVASPTHLPGGAANAALMLVTAGLANAHAASGVRINAVNPGRVLTDRLKQGLAAEAAMQSVSVEQAQQSMLTGLPIGRIATPKEIASVVVFLSSDQASYVTGVIMSIDGACNPIVV